MSQKFAILVLVNIAVIFHFVNYASGKCIWYGESHQEGIHWKNTAYRGEAKVLNNPAAEEILKRRCPVLYNDYKGDDPDGIIPPNSA